MAHEADYDVDLFAENVRHGSTPPEQKVLAENEAANEQPANGSRTGATELRRTKFA